LVYWVWSQLTSTIKIRVAAGGKDPSSIAGLMTVSAEAPRGVVVTGVSSGIGHELVQQLLNRGYKVYGSVRKEKDAAQLQAEFGTNFTPLVFDVTDEKAVTAAVDEVMPTRA
jgi:NADP-dependent 3-hydroxy acid dehydrogenase YdfG